MGKTRQGKQDLDSYTIRGTENIVRAGDCVLMKSPVPDDPPYVALVEKLETKKVKVRWYYRPEDTSDGRKDFHGSKELFMSDHCDIQTVETIIGKCTVHSFMDYIQIDKVGNEDYYTRFEYNAVTKKLTSNVDGSNGLCKCGLPCNPDKVMVRCHICKLRFHPACVVDTSIARVWTVCLYSCDKCSPEPEQDGKNSPGQEQAAEEQATEDRQKARKKMKRTI